MTDDDRDINEIVEALRNRVGALSHLLTVYRTEGRLSEALHRRLQKSAAALARLGIDPHKGNDL